MNEYDDMRGVFDGEATESEKSISERTIDVFPDNLEVEVWFFSRLFILKDATGTRFSFSSLDGVEEPSLADEFDQTTTKPGERSHST